MGGKGGGSTTVQVQAPETEFGISQRAIEALDPLSLPANVGVPSLTTSGGIDIPALSLPGLSLEPFLLGDVIAANQFENKLFDESGNLLTSTAPIRDPLVDLLTNVATGTFDATTSPIYKNIFAQSKKGIEDQYGLARENLLSSLPAGGALQYGLSELEGARAQQASALPANISAGIFQDLMSEAFGFSKDAVAQAFAGYGAAGETYADRQGQSIATTGADIATRNVTMGADTRARIEAETAARAQNAESQLEARAQNLENQRRQAELSAEIGLRQREQDLQAQQAARATQAGLMGTEMAGLFGLQGDQISAIAKENAAKSSGTGSMIGQLAVGAGSAYGGYQVAAAIAA